MVLIQNTESTAKTLSGFQKHKYILGFIIPGVCSNVLGFFVFCSFLLYVCGFCFIEPTYKLTYPSTAEFHSLLYLNLCMGKNRNKKLLEMFYLPVLLLGGNGNNCWLPLTSVLPKNPLKTSILYPSLQHTPIYFSPGGLIYSGMLHTKSILYFE